MPRAAAPALLAAIATMAAAPARGQDVTFSDLDGLVIEADIVRDQVVRREGWEFVTENTVRWKVVIGPGDAIENTVSQTSQTSRGDHKSRPMTNSYILGAAREVKTQGGGTGAWEFADGTLSFTRTFKQGGYRASFAFARGAGGLTCTVSDTFGREDGRGAIVMESVIDGSEVTIIRSKLLSTNCRVVKRSE